MCVTRSDGTMVDALYYLEFFLLDRRDFDFESRMPGTSTKLPIEALTKFLEISQSEVKLTGKFCLTTYCSILNQKQILNELRRTNFVCHV